MLGGVLTAIVDAVPRRRRGRLRRASSGSRSTSSTTAPTGWSSPGTTGESPTLDGRRAPRPVRAAVEAVGDRATVVAGTGTYSTAHSVHLTEQAHELGADAFLVVTPYYNKPPQRGHRRALRGGRRGDRPADRRLQHPEPRRRQHRARDDLAARRDRERHGRQAGARRPRPGASHRRDRARPVRGRRRPPAAVPRARRRRRASASSRTSSGPQVAEQVRAVREGDLERAREIDRELGARLRPAEGHHEPDPDQGGAQPARPRGRRLPAAARPADRGRARGDPRLPRAARAARRRLAIGHGPRRGAALSAQPRR